MNIDSDRQMYYTNRSRDDTSTKERMDMTQMKNIKYIIYLGIGVLAFSSFEAVSKPTSDFITPMQLTFYRFLIGGLILLPFALKDIKDKNLKITKRDFAVFTLLGFALVCLSMTLSQYGIKLSDASMSAVLFSSNPLFVAVLSIFILKEKATLSRMVGLGIGIVGLVVSCLHMFNNQTISSDYILGIFLILIAMIVFSCYTVINKRLSSKNGSMVSLSFASIFGAILLIPVMFISAGDKNPVAVFSFDLVNVWPNLLYLSLIGTGIAYYCYFTALDHLNTAFASMSFLIKPGLASVLCAIFLHEQIHVNSIIGIAIIMCGVSVSVFVKPKSRRGVQKHGNRKREKTDQSRQTGYCNKKFDLVGRKKTDIKERV